MILYLDTSALVKLYIEEPGSKEVKQRVKAAQIVSTSRVAYVEARAGIARKFREGSYLAKNISIWSRTWKRIGRAISSWRSRRV